TAVFRCPADKSVLRGTKSQPRLRSYALSGPLGAEVHVYGLDSTYVRENNPRRISEVASPANVYAFVDEQEDAIDDGVYVSQSCRTCGAKSNRLPPTWFELPTD